MNSLNLVVVADVGAGLSPVLLLVLLVLFGVAVGGTVMVRRRLEAARRQRTLPASDEGRASAPALGAPLEDRAVVDAPVEITEGMSLREIKAAKRARLTESAKGSEAAQRERERRKGRGDVLQARVEPASVDSSVDALSKDAPSVDAPSKDAPSVDAPSKDAPSVDAVAVSTEVSEDLAVGTGSEISESPASPQVAQVSKAQEALPDDWPDLEDVPSETAAVADADVASEDAPSSEAEAVADADVASEDAPSSEAEAVADADVASEDAPSSEAEAVADADVASEDAPSSEAEAVADADVASEDAPSSEAEAVADAEAASEDAPSSEAEAVADADVASEEPVSARLDLAPQTELRQGLDRTRGGFISRLGSIFRSQPKLDAGMIEEIEEVLFTADIGAKTGQHLLQVLEERMESGATPDEAWELLRQETEGILRENARSLEVRDSGRPFVVLVVGVNGVGKTTTIGKLAARYRAEGRNVMMVAGDTFRAAAVEQLREWSDRVGCAFHAGEEGADPSGVVFDGLKRAAEEGVDVVLCDTAGRLHTKAPLLDELRKIARVCGKAIEGAPDETVLVLDANTGQNAIQQARMFGEAVKVSGVVMTKLDGTAKGGVVLGLSREMSVPIFYIGIGEALGDLRPFDASEFVEALFS